MELRDLVVTPLLLVIVGVAAIVLRPLFTDATTRPYFLPALWLKIIGALALGFIYQFYYSGGDTFAYHTHGSRVLWEAFMESPLQGIKLFFAQGEYGPGYWQVAEQIWYWRDPKSFFIIRIAFLFDILTYSSYSATGVLFSIIGFIGGWMLFLTFYKQFPAIHRWLALSCLFIPSIIFWGSGILKDTITLSFIGMMTYAIFRLFVERRFSFFYLFLLLLSFYIVFSIKKYIVISFMAAAIVWIFAAGMHEIKSAALRIFLMPVTIILCAVLGYYSINKVVEDDPKYALDKIAQTARVTAYDIRYWTGKDAGSGYSLGELDGTLGSMLVLAPKAINVSLFRPYLWEVSNPLMLLSALEGLLTLLLTLYVLRVGGRSTFGHLKNPVVLFCFIFSMIFAFGVGVSTFNFGTLARYKIPLLPFYLSMLGMLYYLVKRDKNTGALASMEK